MAKAAEEARLRTVMQGEVVHSQMVREEAEVHLKTAEVEDEEQIRRAEGVPTMELVEGSKACVTLGEELEVSFQLVEEGLALKLRNSVLVVHFRLSCEDLR